MNYAKLIFFIIHSSGFTYGETDTHCNPLEELCDPDPALSRIIHIDFTRGGSTSMESIGSPTISYAKGNGAMLSMHTSYQNPMLKSKFYIMFGKVTVAAKASTGAGIVSSIVLQSDGPDRIEYLMHGGDPTRVETNYFGRGDNIAYVNGKYHKMTGKSTTEDFHTYTIVWSADTIKWYFDRQLIRELHSINRPETYPQTPMNIMLGSWVVGESPLNERDNAEWADDAADINVGKYALRIKHITVEDYSTGICYEYTDNSGDWTSIKSHGGQIGASGPVSQSWFKALLKTAKPI